MKNAILSILLVSLFGITNAKATDWMTSFEEAQKLALVTDRLILVDFWASWCGPCKDMDSESWRHDDVKVLMNHYVPLKIDIDRHPFIARDYGVRGIPYMFILDGNGKVLYKHMGYKSRSEVIKMLTKYALNTAFLKQDLHNYYQQRSFATSFRLASKYQDYSLYMDNMDLKREVLDLAADYFRESETLLQQDDLFNKKVFQEKIELFEVQRLLILQNTKKAIRKLKKMDANSINERNISLYDFLNFVAYKMSEDDENANLWKEKLSDYHLKRSQLFVEAETLE